MRACRPEVKNGQTIYSRLLTAEDVAADPRLAHGLELAEQEIPEQQEEMNMW